MVAQLPDYFYSAPFGGNYRQSFGRYFCGSGSGGFGASLLGFIDSEDDWEMVLVESRA